MKQQHVWTNAFYLFFVSQNKNTFMESRRFVHAWNIQNSKTILIEFNLEKVELLSRLIEPK